MQRLSGVASAFGTGFSDHVQGDTTFSTDLATDPVDTLLHLTMTPIAPLHRIGGRRQQRIVKKRQGFFKMRREDFLSGLANPREPPHPLTHLLALAQGRMCPATSVKQRGDMVHDLA